MRAWQAEKRVRKIINEADILLEVLDARFPDLTRIPVYEKYVKKLGKPLILVLNKCDLVPKEYAEDWKALLSKEYPTVFVSTRMRWGSRKLRNAIKEQAPSFPVKVGVFGYPNVGKSSLINLLKGRGVSSVSPRAGYTRGEQIVRISRKIYLIDTPGIIYPRSEEILLLIGGLEPERAEDPELAAEILIRNLHAMGEMEESTLEEYAKRRKFFLKGGEPDTWRAAVDILRRWQRGEIKIKTYDWLKELSESQESHLEE